MGIKDFLGFLCKQPQHICGAKFFLGIFVVVFFFYHLIRKSLKEIWKVYPTKLTRGQGKNHRKHWASISLLGMLGKHISEVIVRYEAKASYIFCLLVDSKAENLPFFFFSTGDLQQDPVYFQKGPCTVVEFQLLIFLFCKWKENIWLIFLQNQKSFGAFSAY